MSKTLSKAYLYSIGAYSHCRVCLQNSLLWLRHVCQDDKHTLACMVSRGTGDAFNKGHVWFCWPVKMNLQDVDGPERSVKAV